MKKKQDMCYEMLMEEFVATQKVPSIQSYSVVDRVGASWYVSLSFVWIVFVWKYGNQSYLIFVV